MNMQDIISAIETMTVLELAELVKALEDKFGVSAAAPMAAVAAAPAAVAAPVEEKTEFDVILKEVGPEKLKVVKAVKDTIGLGLKESKDLVDNAPKTVKEAATKEEAEKIKAALTAVGATVEVK
jgi:large subunit ribosomal protein L7/L12